MNGVDVEYIVRIYEACDHCDEQGAYFSVPDQIEVADFFGQYSEVARRVQIVLSRYEKNELYPENYRLMVFCAIVQIYQSRM